MKLLKPLTRLCAALLLLGVTAVSPGATEAQARILAIGDSMLAANSQAGRSVAANLERLLGERVKDHSVPGAHMIYRLPITGAMGMSIPKQFRGAGYDVVVVNGGGNDLWLGCGCVRCERRLDKLIVREGNRGALPQLFAQILNSGAQVVYVGYLRSPGIHTPIENCKDEGDELEARIARLAGRVRGLHYVSLQDLVPHGDRSYFAFDGIHPSAKASQLIAHRVATTLKRAGF
jgi:lysophospholipase L1-like esterase